MATPAQWAAVDAYIGDRLIRDDPVDALAANAAAGLPPIDVSPAQGRLLQLLTRACGARRVLEIGTLGGYSTIWLARGVGEGGHVLTLEREAGHAEVARANLAAAGFAGRVEVRVGPAAETLAALDGTFDFVFIDADKAGSHVYLEAAVRLTRPGAMIVADNVVRGGDVLDAASADPSVRGVRALFDAVARHPLLSATAVQTVGVKGWDGMLIAMRMDGR